MFKDIELLLAEAKGLSDADINQYAPKSDSRDGDHLVGVVQQRQTRALFALSCRYMDQARTINGALASLGSNNVDAFKTQRYEYQAACQTARTLMEMVSLNCIRELPGLAEHPESYLRTGWQAVGRESSPLSGCGMLIIDLVAPAKGGDSAEDRKVQ